MDATSIVAIAVVAVGIAIPLLPQTRKATVAAWFLLAVCGAVLLFDLVAISTDLGDADGFVDCNSYCSRWQDAITWSGLLSLALTLGLALGLMGRALVARGGTLQN